MIPVAFGNRTDTDLIKMKYLVLALCFCAASAASFGYNPYSPTQQVNRGIAQSAYSTAQVAPATVVIGAKTSYNTAYNAAKSTYKPTYNTAQTGAKATYNGAYNTAQAFATAPVFAAKATYNTAQAVAAAPVEAARATYNTAPIFAAKTVYNAGKESEAGILSYQSDVNSDGFKYNYQTANGIIAQSTGTLRKVDDSNVIVFDGSYQYIAPDGTPVQFTYTADENGYQPRSNLLPVAPPIPEAIARSLEYIRTHPSKSKNY